MTDTLNNWHRYCLSINTVPNFAAQRLSSFWYGPAYYDGLALHFAARLRGTYRSTVHLAK